MSIRPVFANDYLASRSWIDVSANDIDAYVDANMLDSSTAESLWKWRRDGYVVFEGAVDPALIDGLLLDIDELVADRHRFEIEANVRGRVAPIGVFTDEEIADSFVRFQHLHHVSSAARQLSLATPVTELLRHVLLDQATILQSLTFIRGSQQGIHIDYPFVSAQQLTAHLAASWIALEDVSLDSGPLVYWPGTHHLDVSGFFDWGGGSVIHFPESSKTADDFSQYLQHRVEAAGIEPKLFLPKKGDVLVWHGNLMHAGSHIANSALTRRSYVTHYTSLRALPTWAGDAGNAGLNLNGGVYVPAPWTLTWTQLSGAAFVDGLHGEEPSGRRQDR